MRIAYLTTTYPAVSHTFIRRELVQLQQHVESVERFAIREAPHGLVDPDDIAEDRRTFRLLAQPPGRWLRAIARRALPHPVATARGLARALELGRLGHRGMVRHLAYFAEAVLLLDELHERGVDHLHVHFGTNPAAVALLVRSMGGPPYSFTVHGPDEFDAPTGFGLAQKIAGSAFVVAISHFCAAQLQRWVPLAEWGKIRIVHCGVSDEFFEPARPIDPASRVLVCVGRLSPQKGQLLLVEAFADALDRGVDAELVLVGDGELRAQIEALVERRGIQKRVRITGWMSGADVRRELLAGRALVLPSFAEGLPMVIMEAFALGRPVLSSYVAGIPELVVPGESGWLVPAGARDALTEAIAQLMAAPAAELDAMAARGRAAVKSRHYTPTETAKLAEHFREAVQQSSLGVQHSNAAARVAPRAASAADGKPDGAPNGVARAL
jgi:colanic acid/amylovoran biosynthesis glycosyltransferase